MESRLSHREKVLSILLALGCLFLGYDLLRPRTGLEKKFQIETPERMHKLRIAPNLVKNWPPIIGQTFPKIDLFDHEGDRFSFESLAGKPTLVELVAMTCTACQAWSGAHERGTFEDLYAQEDLQSLEKDFPRSTDGLQLSDGTINFVQLIVYNTKLEAPTPADLSAWRRHFGFDSHRSTFIVSGGELLANGTTFRLVPGFFLLDKQLIVRFARLGPGQGGPNDLYWEMLPAIRGLL